MARAKAEVEDNKDAPEFGGELTLLALPLATYRALSNEAFKRKQTLAQAFQEAVALYLNRKP